MAAISAAITAGTMPVTMRTIMPTILTVAVVMAGAFSHRVSAAVLPLESDAGHAIVIPRIDGQRRLTTVLSESPWDRAARVTGFHDVSGETLSESRTEVYAFYDRSSVWFAFRCEGKPVASTGKHDDMIFAHGLALMGMDQIEYVRDDVQRRKPTSFEEMLRYEMATGRKYSSETDDSHFEMYGIPSQESSPIDAALNDSSSRR